MFISADSDITRVHCENGQGDKGSNCGVIGGAEPATMTE